MQEVIIVNRSRELATDSFTFTFAAPRGASARMARQELKYNGFWSMLTKSMPSLPNKHSWSKRTRNTLDQKSQAVHTL